MPQRTIRSLLAMALVSATIALAQSSTSSVTLATTTGNTWQAAQLVGASKGKLFVITVDQPHRRQVCRVQSFTVDKLVCSRTLGGSHTYLPQQILALLLPGDDDLKFRLVLGLNGGLAVAIWATVVLVPTCPGCAAATGVAALLLFGAAGAILIGDDQPDRLLYLAPGQRLTGKFRFVQP